MDTSVALAYLTGGEAISDLAIELFDRCLATGRNAGMLSMITVTELLVRPFRAGSAAVSTVEGFLRHFGDLRLAPIDYATAARSARIRAVAGFSAPDALIVATAVLGGIDRGDERRLLAGARREGASGSGGLRAPGSSSRLTPATAHPCHG
ncbi:MAG: PIN domain-containing protein [Candidatus Limnocylindrales bacterium]